MELQYSGRASLSSMEEEEVLEREREAPKAWDERPSFPTIYRRAKGGRPRRSNLLGGGGQGRFPSPPRHLEGAFPLWDSSLLEP